MQPTRPLFEMLINADENSELEVDFIALVDKPAIKRDFQMFSEYVEPSNGEGKDNFIPRCISYVIGEGKDPDQAVAICNSIWSEHFAGEKISFDYDETLSTERGMELAKKHIANGDDVYIISARSDKEPMMVRAQELGISESHVYATGSNSSKIEKVKELGISKHYDNNLDVVNELNSIGEKFRESFKVVDEEKRIISGPLMIADQKIYRYDPELGEYDVYFSKDTIKQIAIKLAKKGYQKNVNLMHSGDLKLEGVVLFEVFQSDSERGIQPMKGYEDLPDGSLFGSMFVENENAWDVVKKGLVKGFSVEGNFGMREHNFHEMQLQQVIEVLNSITE